MNLVKNKILIVIVLLLFAILSGISFLVKSEMNKSQREAEAARQEKSFLSDDRFEHPPAGKGY